MFKEYSRIIKDVKPKLFLMENVSGMVTMQNGKVFELINAGESIAELSRKSYIHYYSLYNTYKKVKNKLKK